MHTMNQKKIKDRYYSVPFAFAFFTFFVACALLFNGTYERRCSRLIILMGRCDRCRSNVRNQKIIFVTAFPRLWYLNRILFFVRRYPCWCCPLFALDPALHICSEHKSGDVNNMHAKERKRMYMWTDVAAVADISLFSIVFRSSPTFFVRDRDHSCSHTGICPVEFIHWLCSMPLRWWQAINNFNVLI